ncbi:helix-turn-helix domain-containing protein [Paenibacillus massiliensis]|uniref:helix-turn-helix domain-containing protein n=1 Tax=Paenibacillus massiliensis TaxID=225917 RepID=UPI000369325D|nr:AraC family transcriptional regulator [Paenibacillus massiliensis]
MSSFRLFRSPPSLMPLHLYCAGIVPKKQQHHPEGFPEHLMILSHQGSALLEREDGSTRRLRPFQITTVSKELAYTIRPDDSKVWDQRYVGFGGTLSSTLLRTLQDLEHVELDQDGFMKLWLQLIRLWELDLRNPRLHEQMNEVTYRLLPGAVEALLSSESYRKASEGESQSLRPECDTEQECSDSSNRAGFRQALAYMHAHYREELLLQNVAEIVGYSVQHLNRLFHQEYGMTGHQYMQRLRLEHAKQWMLDRPLATMREVADAVGMELNYFIRMYKRRFGVTPGEQARITRDGMLDEPIG